MASLTPRNIDEALKASLRMSAAANGIGSRIAKRFSEIGGVELPRVARSTPRRSSPLG